MMMEYTYPPQPSERLIKQKSEKGLISFASRMNIIEPLVKALKKAKVKYTWRKELTCGSYGQEDRYYEAINPFTKIIKIQRERDYSKVDEIINSIMFTQHKNI